VSIDVRVTTHAGVHEHEAVDMMDHVTQDRLDTTDSGASLLGWADEIAEVDASDKRIAHVPSLHQWPIPLRHPTPALSNADSVSH
jgi:hypothetical protein